jgi:hypothetical protein
VSAGQHRQQTVMAFGYRRDVHGGQTLMGSSLPALVNNDQSLFNKAWCKRQRA